MCILVRNVIIAPISRARLPSDGTCRMQVVTEVGENRRAFPQEDSRNFLNSVLFSSDGRWSPLIFNLSESPLSQMWWLHIRTKWVSSMNHMQIRCSCTATVLEDIAERLCNLYNLWSCKILFLSFPPAGRGSVLPVYQGCGTDCATVGRRLVFLLNKGNFLRCWIQTKCHIEGYCC